MSGGITFLNAGTRGLHATEKPRPKVDAGWGFLLRKSGEISSQSVTVIAQKSSAQKKAMGGATLASTLTVYAAGLYPKKMGAGRKESKVPAPRFQA